MGARRGTTSTVRDSSHRQKAWLKSLSPPIAGRRVTHPEERAIRAYGMCCGHGIPSKIPSHTKGSGKMLCIDDRRSDEPARIFPPSRPRFLSICCSEYISRKEHDGGQAPSQRRPDETVPLGLWSEQEEPAGVVGTDPPTARFESERYAAPCWRVESIRAFAESVPTWRRTR